MATNNYNKYDEDFKNPSFPSTKTVKHRPKYVKSTAYLYPLSPNGLNNTLPYKSMTAKILTAKQVKELQKRNAQLEEENLILKKRLPSSRLAQITIRRCS